MATRRQLGRLAVPLFAALGLVCLAAAPSKDEGTVVEVTAFTTPFRQLDVATEIGGVLTAVHVEEGDAVKHGQVLAEFKSDPLRARLMVSEARIRSAQLELEARRATREMLQAEYARAATLREQNVLSVQQFTKAKLEMELGGLDVQAAEAQQKVVELMAAQDRAELERTVVRAPMDGRVFRIYKRAGEAVELHGPILNMVSVDPLYVIGYAPVSTAGQVDVGMGASLEMENLAGRKLQCTVAVVDRVADAASGTYRIKLTLPNPEDALTAGAKGKLTLVLPEQRVHAQKGDSHVE